jgi:dTDP-4-amino-4,6-dideoxygalactose transaminase
MSMTVKYLDLPRQFQDEELFGLIRLQFERCQFVMGPEVEEFEAKFAVLCGVPHALGLNSGTDAIFLALKALDIGPGDEVITVPNSFVATAGAIAAAGAKPVFVDVAADYNMDVTLIESAITPHTKALLPVHLTGNPADMKSIMEIAKKHGLFVIEDAAQAVTASIDGKRVGSFGEAGAFSLHPLKNLNVSGDGGALTTGSADLRERVRMLRNHGLKNRDEIGFFGYNSRLDTIQAIVANHVMKNVDAVTTARQKNAAIYDREFAGMEDRVVLPPRRANVKQVFHTYIIRAKNRPALIEHLAARGIETKIHYPVPIHLQVPCLELGYRPGDFPECERQSGEILSLPVHQHLSEEQVRYVADTVRSFYGA